MTQKMQVEVVEYKSINEISGAWAKADYHAILNAIGLDDGLDALSEKDLKEMCFMSLNELEPPEAAKIVLDYVFAGEDLTDGKTDQLAHDLPDDKLWEQSPELDFHYRLFNAYSLLRQAYNGIFPQPTGVELTLKVTVENPEDLAVFDVSPKAPMARLLAAGMGDKAIINRLYDKQIAGSQFAEAEDILWVLESLSSSDVMREFKIVSSSFWLEDMQDITQFEAETYADADEASEETEEVT